MKSRFVIAVVSLLAGVLACSAPGGSAATPSPAVVTVVVTSAGDQANATQAATEAASTGQETAPAGINCVVQQDVRIHSCVGTSSASVVGSSPASSQFAPTKWDGQNWFYGQVPTANGPTWGWVSRLNSDGSTLVACTGDTSALPKVYEPCPTAVPTATSTATNTPTPSDTPTPLATATASDTPAALCGNGVADTGEQCGEPVFLACSGGKICKSCKCVFPILLNPTLIVVQP